MAQIASPCSGLVLTGALVMLRLGMDQLLLGRLGIRLRGLLPRLALVHVATIAGLCTFESSLQANHLVLAPRGCVWLLSFLATLEYGLMRLVRVPGPDRHMFALRIRQAALLSFGGYACTIAIFALPALVLN